MAAIKSELRQMSWPGVWRGALVALAIGLSPLVFAGMLFQPGWANGWAIPQSVVYATFVTILFAVSVTSLATAALLVICYLAEERTKRPYLGWASFIVLSRTIREAAAIALQKVEQCKTSR
jgi:hypothetical protein